MLHTTEDIDAWMKANQEKVETERTEFAKLRAEVRTKVLADALIIGKHGTEFEADFDGEGDSGDVHADTGVKIIDEFLEKAVETFVEFDWYNNSGGGGDITWDLKTDKIIINGYTRYTETEAEMSEAEF
jgi:hypothetical protein